MRTFEELAAGPITEQVENMIETDPTVALLTQQLALQEAALAGLLSRLGVNHREVRRVRGLVNETRERRQKRRVDIAEQVRLANLRNVEDQLTVLQERFTQLEKLRQETAAKKRSFDLARTEYQKVLSIRDERRLMLDKIKEQIERLRVMRNDPRTPKVLRVGPALPPLRVSSPMWYFYFPGGTVLGLISGVGLAFLIELLNDLVRTPRDVGRYLHIPLLGVIPHAAEDGQLRDVDLCHVVRQAPYSVISESYRQLRTNLKLCGPMDSLKALLISSGGAGDGKTTVAVNLATTFVAENKRVLVIDANFWRPSLHTVFPRTEGEAVERSALGLSNLLMGQCGYEEVIRPSGSGIDGLDIIDSGPLPSNPAELLGGVQMEQLVKQERESYDYVIVDSPPVLLVSASKMLARVVDGTVLVFNAGATRRGAAQRTIRELKEVNATIVGCALLAVQAMKGGYFREQFKSFRKYQKLQLAQSV
jgi:capsular exopolysaccharide synthesis family protein